MQIKMHSPATSNKRAKIVIKINILKFSLFQEIVRVLSVDKGSENVVEVFLSVVDSKMKKK